MKKLIAKLLLITMLVGNLPMQAYAASSAEIKGQVDMTINLNYPIKSNEGNKSGIFVKIAGEKKNKEVFELVQELRVEGEEVSSINLSDLAVPQGTYTLSLEGAGYTAISQEFFIDKHDMAVKVDANAFLAGDTNQDGEVNKDDINLLENKIGTTDYSKDYDLNRDGKLDITDLTYTYFNQQEMQGDSLDILRTALIAQTVIDTAGLEETLKKETGVIVDKGSIDDLFNSKDTVVTLKGEKPIKEQQLAIPVAFEVPVEMERVAISIGKENRPTALTVEVEIANENGTTSIEKFSYAAPAVARNSAAYRGREVYSAQSVMFSYAASAAAIGQSIYSAQNVINIDLGQKVPVKKVTIKVTKVEDETSKLVDIAKVEFLENILENAGPVDKGIIKNLKVSPGDQELTATWDQASNVTGYTVEYGNASGQYTQSVKVSNNKVVLRKFNGKDLINYTPYYIVVTATNGDWKGETSEEVVGVPKPRSVPLPPDNPRAEPGNEKIYFSWKAAESTKGYNVYYKVRTDKEYTKVEHITSAQYAINNLQNGIEYEMYVTAYNELGESRPSTSVVCIPEKEDIKIPDVPTYNLINTPNGKTEGIKTDHIIKVEMRDKNNVHPEYPKGFTIEDVVDGDYYTHWAARVWWENKGITVTFDEPYEMDYMAYISRLDGKYKDSLSRYSITVWESDDAAPKTLVSGQPIPSYTRDGLAILPFKKSMVKKITVEIAQWDGSPTNISASELKFYKYYSLNDDIRSLFANNIYTVLAADVTQEKIDHLRAMVNGLEGRYYLDSEILLQELDMAEALLQGSTAKLGTIVDVYRGRTTNEDGKRGFAMSLNTDQPLGVSAKANEKIIVYVDAPEGKELPQLVFSQYFAEPGNYRQSVPLARGRNIIKVPNIGSYSTSKGGSVYIAGTDVKDMTIHLKGIQNSKKEPSLVAIPKLTVLDLHTGTESEIKQRLKTYIEELEAHTKLYKGQTDYRNTTEIETRKNLLSLPATKVLEGIKSGGVNIDTQVEQLWQTINAWEEMMTLHYTMMGLSEDAKETYNQFPTSRMNTRYMRMFGKAFMYATGGHIGIGYGSVPGTIQGKSALNNQIAKYFGWGINHEVGHVLNYGSYAFAEVTNNIFSLFAQEANQEEIRIKGKYPQIYEKVSVPTAGRPGDVFVNLGMYWQLHLAYDDNKVMEQGDFYPRLHRAYRESNVPGGDEGFAMIASEMAKEDLTEFFTHWGVQLSESTKATIAAKNYPKAKKVYYMNDDAFAYRLAGGKGLNSQNPIAVAMNATIVEATDLSPTEKDNNSQRVELKIDVNSDMKEHILGYEILRNDEVIGFTTEPSYIDIIGAANNRAFKYSVKVYDKLLNEVGATAAPEVKVSHDGALSKDGWTVERTTSGAILIDMQKVNAVAGIKFKNLPEGENNYTVKVKQVNTTTGSAIRIDGDWARTTTGPAIEVSNWIVAKDGKVKGIEGLEYFNKPGAPSSDTRIWTYDARYIQIEGINNLTLDQIDIVSYPGDNIEIRPGAIGKLGHDYVYGPGAESIIKAGTVVIVGDYRGDAVYNVIKPRGIFEVGTHGAKEEETHVINGYSLMLAEIPEDGAVSTISDGIWIYVPDEEPFVGALGESGSITEGMTEEQKELLEETKAVLQRIKVELYRVDNPETLENERLVSDSIWIEVPAEDEIPIINLVAGK